MERTFAKESECCDASTAFDFRVAFRQHVVISQHVLLTLWNLLGYANWTTARVTVVLL